MTKKKTITVDGREISILSQTKTGYVSLTDRVKSQLHEVVIIKWLSLKSTMEYIGEWEASYHPNFNDTNFGTMKNSGR